MLCFLPYCGCIVTLVLTNNTSNAFTSIFHQQKHCSAKTKDCQNITNAAHCHKEAVALQRKHATRGISASSTKMYTALQWCLTSGNARSDYSEKLQVCCHL